MGERRRLDIQGLRAIAVVMVVAFHAGLRVPGGFTGVDVFFVISGFVITNSLVGELERTGSLSLRAFYRRRVKRLLPALAVLVTFVAAAGILLDPTSATRISGLTGVFASFFAANLYLWSLPTGYFDVSTQLDPLLHTWTLAVEEQFYLVFPLVLLMAWRLRGRRAAMVAIALVACGSFAVAAVAPTALAYYWSPARAWEFAVGCLIALAAPTLSRLPGLAGAMLGALGASAVVIAAAALSPYGSVLTVTVTPVLGAAALLMAGFVPRNPVSQLLATRPLETIGDLSYSWYLWHWPLIVFAAALMPGEEWPRRVAALLSLAPAWWSYRYIENPIRFDRRIRGRVVVALGVACVAVPVAVSASTLSFKVVDPPTFATAEHGDVNRGCDSAKPFGDSSRGRCSWPTPNARGTVVLIGDSNAGHFTEPVVEGGNRDGFDVEVATFSACPFVQLRLSSGDASEDAACHHFDVASLEGLVAARPALVIVASRADGWINQSMYAVGLEGGSLTRDPAAKQRLWASGLRSEIAALNRVGVPVIVVHPVPVVPIDESDCAVVLLIAGRCTGTVSRDASNAELARALDAEREAVRRGDATVLSFSDLLCTARQCSTMRDGVSMYRDRYHLSVQGSLRLASAFAAAVAARAR